MSRFKYFIISVILVMLSINLYAKAPFKVYKNNEYTEFYYVSTDPPYESFYYTTDSLLVNKYLNTQKIEYINKEDSRLGKSIHTDHFALRKFEASEKDTLFYFVATEEARNRKKVYWIITIPPSNKTEVVLSYVILSIIKKKFFKDLKVDNLKDSYVYRFEGDKCVMCNILP